jgi:heme-degrading monooxygenase HmoA
LYIHTTKKKGIILLYLLAERKRSWVKMAFRRTIARLNRVYRLSERHIAPGYEHKVKDVMDNIKREVVNQPGLISIEVLTEKNKPDAYFALTCWEDQDALDTWLNSDLCKDVRNRLDPVIERPVASKEFQTVTHDVFLL